MGERGADFLVNDAIKDYIFDLHQATRFSRNQSEVDALYGAKFQELSKTYYSDKTAWPSPTTISNLVPSPTTGKGSDDFFLCFYKEMADRHLFANGRTTAQDSVDAWTNYCSLFEKVINSSADMGMTINQQWAFEVVHEFVYSLQAFCQYRGDLSRRDPADVATLRANPNVWDVAQVAKILTDLVRVSNVEEVLASAKAAGVSVASLDLGNNTTSNQKTQAATNAALGFVNPSNGLPPSKLHFDLGYFALFGLSRLECLLGDYHGCLSAVSAIDLFSENEYYHKVFGCYLQLHYHCGVAYLMSRRFKDATRTLSHVVSHVNRLAKTGSLFHMSGGDEQAAKKTVERSCTLLAITAALTPGCKVEEVASGMGKDLGRVFVERVSMLEAAGSDSSEFEQLFEKACPKFVSGVLPNFGTGSGDNDDDDDAECMSGSAANLFEPVRRQILLLGKEAASVAGHTNKLRSFLKLYTAIEIEKLAKFQAASEGTEQTPKTIRADLMATKHLMAQMESNAGSGPLGGSVKSALDVHFYVAEGGLIHVDDSGSGGGGVGGDDDACLGHDGFFMEEIHRAEQVALQVKEQARRFEATKAAAVEAALAKKSGGGGGYGDGDEDEYGED